MKRIVLVGGTAAPLQALLFKLNELSVHAYDAGEAIQTFGIRCGDSESLANFNSRDFKINQSYQPEVKRGKGKIKRW